MTLAISELMETFSLVDAWRIYNPHKKQFTWSQGITNKQGRLDYFICNEELLSISKDYQIKTKYRSDHNPISCTLTIDSEERGPGTWKFNNELLLEEDFNTLIKKSISEIKRTYAATPNNPECIDMTHKNINLTISSALFWVTMLVTLRGNIIYYSKRRKKAKNNRMVNLEARIQELDTKVNTGNATNQDFTLLAELNSNLQELRQADLQGAYIRSRANLIEFGKSLVSYFSTLKIGTELIKTSLRSS